MKVLKRISVFLVVLCLSQSLAIAGISINLKDSWGLYYPDGATPLPSGALIQLIWSADAVYSGFGAGSGPLDTEVSGGDYSAYGDYLLWSGYGNIAGGFDFDVDAGNIYSNSHVGGNAINNGYVFAYIFQDNIPNGGDFFARSTISASPMAEATNLPAPPPDDIDFCPTVPVTLDTYTIQVVPEPSTMVLMLLGFVAIGGFKKRSRK